MATGSRRDLNRAFGAAGWTPLLWCAHTASDRLLNALLDLPPSDGVDVDARTRLTSDGGDLSILHVYAHAMSRATHARASSPKHYRAFSFADEFDPDGDKFSRRTLVRLTRRCSVKTWSQPAGRRTSGNYGASDPGNSPEGYGLSPLHLAILLQNATMISALHRASTVHGGCPLRLDLTVCDGLGAQYNAFQFHRLVSDLLPQLVQQQQQLQVLTDVFQRNRATPKQPEPPRSNRAAAINGVIVAPVDSNHSAPYLVLMSDDRALRRDTAKDEAVRDALAALAIAQYRWVIRRAVAIHVLRGDTVPVVVQEVLAFVVGSGKLWSADVIAEARLSVCLSSPQTTATLLAQEAE